MSNVTTYFAARRNILLWLAAALSAVSAAARIAFACRIGDIGFAAFVVRILLPVAANLLIAVRLPLRGEKQFYVTVIPVMALSFYLGVAGVTISGGMPAALLFIILSAVFAGLYFLTFTGKLGSRLPLLVYMAAVSAMFCLDVRLGGFVSRIWPSAKALLVSDAAMLLSVAATVLCAKKMPPVRPGEPYRLRFGDRSDGRLIRSMPVMSKITPFFMMNRLNRSNLISGCVEISGIEYYIRRKRREGLKHFGITHVIIASYVRMLAEMPEINRFVAGQRIYHRLGISVNMVVKKEMNRESPDSSIKVFFNPADTAAQVYEKFDDALELAKAEGISNGFDFVTHILNYVPSVVMALFGLLLRAMDYFGFMPEVLEKVSPFHGSLFITSMGSLGIPPVYHHLYDFGTVPVFCAFGHKYTKYELGKDGAVTPVKYMDYKIVCDEGICDGFSYASAMKKFRSNLLHPEKLDVPPEVIAEDIE